MKPSTWRLLKAIEIFMETTHISGMLGASEVDGLFHVCGFAQILVEEGVQYVKLTYMPFMTNFLNNLDTYRVDFDNICEGVGVVKSSLMVKTFGHQLSFMATDVSSSVIFKVKDPLIVACFVHKEPNSPCCCRKEFRLC